MRCVITNHKPNHPPAINPTDADGNYRPEYIEWLRNLEIETWGDIRVCLESKAFDYAEWDGDEDGFTIRLYADKKDNKDGFEYIFSVNTDVYDGKGSWWDVESADMRSEYWHLVQACAFMWQQHAPKWLLLNY